MPVPELTARTIISPRSRAVVGRHGAVDPLGRVLSIVTPFGDTSSGRRRTGCIRMPALPIAPATIAICSGVTSSRSCPNAIRPGVDVAFRCGYQSSPSLYSPLGSRSSRGVSSGGRS